MSPRRQDSVEMTVADAELHGGSEALQRATLGRQIADALRRDILFGKIPPGTHVSQQELCERFGTSRMPARDALRQLTYEGFLITDAGRHSIVAKLSQRDLLDMYVIEGMLHGLATRRVTEEAADEELATLESLHRQMLEAARESAVEVVADLNWTFHRRINLLANSRRLIAALRTLSLDIPRDYVVAFPEWTDRANAEHEEIMQALRIRDADRAERLMRAHVTNAGVGLLEFLKAQGLEID